MRFLFLFLLFISTGLYAQVKLSKAIVYGGVGACTDDCVAGAVEAARVAGLDPIVVDPNTFSPEMLEDAVIWIQPGGKSRNAANAMGSKMLSHIKEFIRNGGGYVGFCAGAFLSTPKIGTSTTKGLGIVSGKTILYKGNRTYPSIEKVNFVTAEGVKTKDIYWEGGPYFTSLGKGVEVMARYSRTNQISSVRTVFGKGRVAVTGDHPEAPEWWRTSSNLLDKDGLDYDVTSQMILWAMKK